MPAPKNELKANLDAGKTQIGLWLGSGVPVFAEIAARAGFDWCLIDCEHNPNGDAAALVQMQAMGSGTASAAMRVVVGDDHVLKRALDIGAQTLVVPMVDTAEQAARIASACRYPPEGHRGMGAGQARATFYGEASDYVQTCNDEICLFVQAESRASVENIDAIAATPGVNGIFIGPADLSADMGYPGDPGAPEVQDAIAHIAERTLAAGKHLGTITFDPANVPQLRDLGVNFLAVGGDIALFADASRGLAGMASGLLSQK